MSSATICAAPASLKGVLSAKEAACALADGFARGGVSCDELPVADGGEGTLGVLQAALGGEWRSAEVPDAFGHARRARWLLLPDGTAALESAEAVPLDPGRLLPLEASSRGLGELIKSVGSPKRLLLGLGGTATMDAGLGLLEVLPELPAPTVVLCDVNVGLYEAPASFGQQKGATPAQIAELEARFRSADALRPHSGQPGSGAAGGLGAALALLGAELAPGAAYILDLIGFDPVGYSLVVTGEGVVDATTAIGKAPGEVVRRTVSAGIRCAAFGGRVEHELAGAEMHRLSGRPERVRDDLAALGEELARDPRLGAAP